MEDTARAFKISGYCYQDTKKELLKFKELDPLNLIKKRKIVRSKPTKGVRAFFISGYDPRMPHPRQLISRNYHHLQNHPLLSKVEQGDKKTCLKSFPPSVQQAAGGGDDPADDGPGGGGHWNGSYHCPAYKSKGRCDVCSHMVETSTIYSHYFQRRFAIHGHNVHLPAAQKNKLCWFIYCCEDTLCSLQYIGSTTDVCKRWASNKKACLDCDSVGTGLYKHFKNGCPGGSGGGDLNHLRWTI